MNLLFQFGLKFKNSYFFNYKLMKQNRSLNLLKKYY